MISIKNSSSKACNSLLYVSGQWISMNHFNNLLNSNSEISLNQTELSDFIHHFLHDQSSVCSLLISLSSKLKPNSYSVDFFNDFIPSVLEYIKEYIKELQNTPRNEDHLNYYQSLRLYFKCLSSLLRYSPNVELKPVIDILLHSLDIYDDKIGCISAEHDYKGAIVDVFGVVFRSFNSSRYNLKDIIDRLQTILYNQQGSLISSFFAGSSFLPERNSNSNSINDLSGSILQIFDLMFDNCIDHQIFDLLIRDLFSHLFASTWTKCCAAILSCMMPQFGPKMKKLFQTKIENDLFEILDEKYQFDEYTLESIGLMFGMIIEHIPELSQEFYIKIFEKQIKMMDIYNNSIIIAPTLYSIQLCIGKINQISITHILPRLHGCLSEMLINSGELIRSLCISCITSIIITNKTLDFDLDSIKIQLINTLKLRTSPKLQGEALESLCIIAHKLKMEKFGLDNIIDIMNIALNIFKNEENLTSYEYCFTFFGNMICNVIGQEFDSKINELIFPWIVSELNDKNSNEVLYENAMVDYGNVEVENTLNLCNAIPQRVFETIVIIIDKTIKEVIIGIINKCEKLTSEYTISSSEWNRMNYVVQGGIRSLGRIIKTLGIIQCFNVQSPQIQTTTTTINNNITCKLGLHGTEYWQQVFEFLEREIHRPNSKIRGDVAEAMVKLLPVINYNKINQYSQEIIETLKNEIFFVIDIIVELLEDFHKITVTTAANLLTMFIRNNTFSFFVYCENISVVEEYQNRILLPITKVMSFEAKCQGKNQVFGKEDNDLIKAILILLYHYTKLYPESNKLEFFKNACDIISKKIPSIQSKILEIQNIQPKLCVKPSFPSFYNSPQKI